MSSESTGQGGAGRPGRLRVLLILGFATLALGIGIVGISTREPSQEFQVVEGTADARRIFGGIRQLGERLGDEGAPVQIQVFTDVQSSGFADWFLEVLPAIVNGPVRSGDVNLLYRNRSFTRNATELSFYGVEAAGAQNYTWQYAYLVVRNQDLAIKQGLDDDFLEMIAESIEFLDLPEWREAYDSGLEPGSEMTASLEEQDKLAIDLRLAAEPAVVVAGPLGTEVLQDAPDATTIENAIAQVR